VPLRDITGHRRVVELLSRSIARNRLPPSLIFAGPSGTGKRDTAIAVAQLLNCLKPRDGDACGECAQCTRIARGVHPDVMLIEPGDSGAIKIEPIRDAIDRASYRPFEGKRRVVIVNDADALVPAAQNALLKTLEEPSPSSVFILTASRPDMLLQTVRSRCIRLMFAEAGRLDTEPAARAVAQRVLAQAASSIDSARLDGAKELLSSTGATAASDREQVNAHLRAMASLLRDIEIIATRADQPLANAELKPSLERLAPAYGGERGVRAFAAIERAMAAITGNTGIKVVADWLVLQL
jgi:DNA polymerase III subunit delta'